MKNDSLYRLADTTLVECLAHSWPAWPNIIAPAPASLHLLQYQIPLLRSYLENPAVHALASKESTLTGGAFINIAADRFAEISSLLETARVNLSHNLELAQSVLEFQSWLIANASGLSMEPCYQKIPNALRGYVELVYDYFNRPSLRFFENLMYMSPYYNSQFQSLRLSRLNRDGDRPFFLTTPRLMERDQINWQTPFDSPEVDRLFELDRAPQPFNAICRLLDLDEQSQNLLPLLLTEGALTPAPKWDEKSVRVKYFGHACLLIESEGTSILTDPLIAVFPAKGGLDRYSFKDLPEKIDYALITHNHRDHACIDTLLRLRNRIHCLVVPRSAGLLYGDISLKLLAKRIGFKNVIELDAMEEVQFPGGEITGIPFLGEHADLAHGKTGYVIRLSQQKILIGADSDCLDKRIYENVRRGLGRVDAVFLGTESVGAPLSWTYGPLLPKKPSREEDESRRQHGCDARRAIDLLEVLGANRLYVYGMGIEPWLEHILGLGLKPDSPQWMESDNLLMQAASRGFIAAERLYGKAEFLLEKGRPFDGRTKPGGSQLRKPENDAIATDDAFVFEFG
jgi:L-ascorbate metabolism protein UlaG (beta-lactamase superfamily)